MGPLRPQEEEEEELPGAGLRHQRMYQSKSIPPLRRRKKPPKWMKVTKPHQREDHFYSPPLRSKQGRQQAGKTTTVKVATGGGGAGGGGGGGGGQVVMASYKISCLTGPRCKEFCHVSIVHLIWQFLFWPHFRIFFRTTLVRAKGGTVWRGSASRALPAATPSVSPT